MRKLTKYEEAFYELDYQDREPWLKKALAKYDSAMVCPVCRGLLTGMHERTTHFQSYIAKAAAKMWQKAQNEQNI